MCCRYWVDKSPELRAIVEEMNRSALVERWQESGITPLPGSLEAGWEVRPTDVVPVIAPDRSGNRAVYPMKWGYSGRSLLVNARSESAAEKPTFREDWARHRCIVPASRYFEWEHYSDRNGRKRTGDKYSIRPKEASMTWLCGLYRIENGLPVFVVLTREPGEEIRFIHDRMPLIMPDDLVNEWIRPEADPKDLLSRALTDMAFEKTF